ncbi:MAG: hypothetical protein CBC13_07520 [Planctomycetia bacterium TMED53]|nr:MAG: hypothetical protein CBC13_07520 [Planctomycetia bacterium TMED53]
MKIHVEAAEDQALVAKFLEADQGHLFDDWETLDSLQKRRLLDDLNRIDLGFLQQLIRDHLGSDPDHPPIATPAPPPMIELGDPARSLATQEGLSALSKGEIGVLLLAGGVGTRLGHAGPKGSYPLLPISGMTLFQFFAESLLRRQKEVGAAIPWWIMTSPSNHEDTVSYFQEHDYHGLSSADVTILPQEELPVIDPRRGRILRKGPGQILFSPDGHGGAIRLIQRHAEDFRKRGIRHVYTHQVDNPLSPIGDPELVGLHLHQGSQFSSKAVSKTDPDEKVGVFCQMGEHLRIIEYSELGDEERHRRDSDGELSFRAGNVAMHVIDLDFILGDSTGSSPALPMPFHMAQKQVRHWLDNEWHEEEQPNSLRFETFIFDVLPLAKHAIVVEAARENEFAPVKNREGSDSPETSRQALQRLWANWLEEAGHSVERDSEGLPSRTIEISPRIIGDAQQLAKHLSNMELPAEGPILIQ